MEECFWFWLDQHQPQLHDLLLKGTAISVVIVVAVAIGSALTGY